MTNENLEVIKLADSNPEFIDTANALVAFAEGQELTINAESLLDFYEFTKRLKKQVDVALSVVENYVRAKCDEDGVSTTKHFDFAAPAKSLAVTDEAEVIRILKEDLGKDDEFIIASSKLDPKLLEKNLKSYTREGMLEVFPHCIELKAAKARMLVK